MTEEKETALVTETASAEENADIAASAEVPEQEEQARENIGADIQPSDTEQSEGNDGSLQSDTVDSTEEAQQNDGKKKIKLPAFLQKFIAYLKAHEDVRQMVYFFLFSMICGASQLIVTYALSAGLKLEHISAVRDSTGLSSTSQRRRNLSAFWSAPSWDRCSPLCSTAKRPSTCPTTSPCAR